MEQVHAQEDIFEFENCVVCHPTGREGEGKLFRDSYYIDVQAEAGQGDGTEINQGTQESIPVLEVGQARVTR
jgi:hypothetical protein